jgi:release factor H-coupled RctB family protein
MEAQMSAPIRIIASPASWIETAAVDQLRQTAALDGIDAVVGLPDLHAGRGIAVGAAFWSRDRVFPHLVGSDIGCGMALWQTGTSLRKFRLDSAERKLHGLDEGWEGDCTGALVEAGLPASLTPEGLGTIGGGNHFAEMLRVEQVLDAQHFAEAGLDASTVLLMVHSGSRGLGQAILDAHLANGHGSSLMVGTAECAAYLRAHDQAVRWAVLNREVIAGRFLDRLGMAGVRLLDICHNSVTAHQGGWLHRKGAAPADKGLVVVPGSRGDLSYVVRPRAERAGEALHSLAHGAGRKWSRGEARDKLARRYSVADLERTAMGSRVICEDRALLYEEAPPAYKDIHRVIGDLEDAGLIDRVATLRPLLTYKVRRA